MGIMIEDNYLENPEFAMQCMTPVIEAAIKQNIYIIIDWHSHLTKTAEAKEFFGRMAQNTANIHMSSTRYTTSPWKTVGPV